MSDQVVDTMRLAIIVCSTYSAILIGWFSWRSRHDLSRWQGLTRASISMAFAAMSFATLSNLLRWHADGRVTVLLVACTGLVVGLTGTVIEQRKDPRR